MYPYIFIYIYMYICTYVHIYLYHTMVLDITRVLYDYTNEQIDKQGNIFIYN